MPSPDTRTDARRCRLPMGLVGMLALVAAVEFGLSRSDLNLTPLGACNWRRTGVVARTEAVRVDVLIFGDSLAKTGLSPAMFEEERGLSAYNLALLGAPPSASYFMFRRALDAGAKPRAVVLDAQPSILMSNGPAINPREWSELLDSRELLELARVEKDYSIVAPILLNRYVPSVRYRFDVQTAIRDLFKTRVQAAEVPWLALHDRQQATNRGAYINPGTPGRFGADPRPNGKVSKQEEPFCYPEMWWGRPANLAFIEKFLALAESRSIPVFFLLPPIHPGVQAERERLGLEAPYLALVTKIHKRFPSVVVIDGRHSGFDHGLFWDAFHLGREGATALSLGVADVIGTHLDGAGDDSRWITLPSFREPGRRVAIEDVDESRAKLR